MNRVSVKSPGRDTVTGMLHAAFLKAPSVAVQVAVVDPIGKFEPLGGVHATVTGMMPPVAVGVA
jgi:hypothetical protein